MDHGEDGTRLVDGKVRAAFGENMDRNEVFWFGKQQSFQLLDKTDFVLFYYMFV